MTSEQYEAPEGTYRPQTWELVVYDSGTSAVSKYDRGPTGELTYIGREFHDRQETARMLGALGGRLHPAREDEQP